MANLGARFAWLIIGRRHRRHGPPPDRHHPLRRRRALQVVTLPVEYDASRRAGQQLQALGIATTSEVAGTKQVLNAAALTYVAAAATSVLYLLYYLSMIMGSRD